MTTKELIKMLPFEKQFKEELLLKYDAYSPDQRFSIERIIWGYYYSLYQARLDRNMQAAFTRAKQNEETLDKTFYERVRQQTEKELQAEYGQTETDLDLSSARVELEKLIKKTD